MLNRHLIKTGNTQIFASNSRRLINQAEYKDVNIVNGDIEIKYANGDSIQFSYGDMSQVDREAMHEYIQERTEALKQLLGHKKLLPGQMSALKLRAESEFLANYGKGKILDVQDNDIVTLDKTEFNAADDIDRLELKGYISNNIMTLPEHVDGDKYIVR